MQPKITPQEKQHILETAEQWALRFYQAPVTVFLNMDLSDFQAGRYVVDVALEGHRRWISLEVQMKDGVISIPGGAIITGRGSLAGIHRRFS